MTLAEELKALVEDEELVIPNLANASAFIMDKFSDLNWAGFYLLHGETLVLGPFQGKPACIRIEKGRGVCGKALEEKRTLRVDNVHSFEGHIACDSASNSEIVIPLFKDGKALGVLDIDSPLYSRFSQEDQRVLEELAQVIQDYIFK